VQPIIKTHRAELAAICRRFSVRKLGGTRRFRSGTERYRFPRRVRQRSPRPVAGSLFRLSGMIRDKLKYSWGCARGREKPDPLPEKERTVI
jgi:hypothetical protein